MCATIAKTSYTPADLLYMPDSANYELVDGQLVERHMGTLSNWIAGAVFGFLWSHCHKNQCGSVFGSEASYQCFSDAPDKIRKPDASFVARDRLPLERLPRGHCTVAPDLAVEVLSPNDLIYEVDVKVAEYLAAGVRLVWIVNPDTRTLRIFRPDGTITGLREKDEVTGEDVLPGFRCRVAGFFPPPQQRSVNA